MTDLNFTSDSTTYATTSGVAAPTMRGILEAARKFRELVRRQEIEEDRDRLFRVRFNRDFFFPIVLDRRRFFILPNLPEGDSMIPTGYQTYIFKPTGYKAEAIRLCVMSPEQLAAIGVTRVEGSDNADYKGRKVSPQHYHVRHFDGNCDVYSPERFGNNFELANQVTGEVDQAADEVGPRNSEATARRNTMPVAADPTETPPSSPESGHLAEQPQPIGEVEL